MSNTTPAPSGVVSSAELGLLPEADYYSATDYESRPRLLHSRAEVERHLKSLENLGGSPVPWDGNVCRLYSEATVGRIVAAAVATERERCEKLLHALAKECTWINTRLALQHAAVELRVEQPNTEGQRRESAGPQSSVAHNQERNDE